MRLTHPILAGVLALAALPDAAAAVPVLWSVDYTNSTGNVVVTGTFVYDADINEYSAVNVAATDDFGISNTTYSFVSPFNAVSSSDVVFRNQEDADRTGEKRIDFTLFGALTNAGGVIANSPSALFIFNVMQCNDAACGTTTSLAASGEPSRSTLTGTPLLPTIPAPAALPLLLGGLGMGAGGLALTRRRRG